jgi:hypothetical protein
MEDDVVKCKTCGRRLTPPPPDKAKRDFKTFDLKGFCPIDDWQLLAPDEQRTLMETIKE